MSQAINRVVKKNLHALLEGGTVQDVFIKLAGLAQEEIRDVTADAVQLGFDTARRLADD